LTFCIIDMVASHRKGALHGDDLRGRARRVTYGRERAGAPSWRAHLQMRYSSLDSLPFSKPDRHKTAAPS
jgi:hypothetical protein